MYVSFFEDDRGEDITFGGFTESMAVVEAMNAWGETSYKSRFRMEATPPFLFNGCLVFRNRYDIHLPSSANEWRIRFAGIREHEYGGKLLYAWPYVLVVPACRAYVIPHEQLQVSIPFRSQDDPIAERPRPRPRVTAPVSNEDTTEKRFSLVVDEVKRDDKGGE